MWSDFWQLTPEMVEAAVVAVVVVMIAGVDSIASSIAIIYNARSCLVHLLLPSIRCAVC